MNKVVAVSGYFDPIHVAAFTGNASLFKALTKRVKNSQPGDHYGGTPLHYAAAGGQLKICQLIMEKIKDQVPRDQHNETPLHFE